MKKELHVIRYEDVMGATRCICVRGTIEEAMIDSSAKAPKKDEDVPYIVKKGTHHATTRGERRVQKAAHKRRDRSHKVAHERHMVRLAYGRGMWCGTNADDIRYRRNAEAEEDARNDDIGIVNEFPKLAHNPIVINGMIFRDYKEIMRLPTIGQLFDFGTAITVTKK